jgi:hypothetical protein
LSYPTLVFSTDKPCDQAVAEVIRHLQDASFLVVRTFDLHVAREPYSGEICGSCPNHNLEQCSCQMVILLVYREGQGPVSLVARGIDNRTWFDMVESPDQRIESRALIRQALVL